jgi:hypothetical protein
MSKLATLLIAAALFSPTFVQAMPKAPAMIAGDESTMPTPEKKATAHRARKAKRAKKKAAAEAAAPAAPSMIAGDESTTPTPEKAKTARKAARHKKAKKLPPPADPSAADNPAKP